MRYEAANHPRDRLGPDWKGFQVCIKETRLFLKAKGFRERFVGNKEDG